MNTITEPPLGRFEERLLAELKEFVSSQPGIASSESRAPRHLRALLAGTAIAASAALAAGLLFATTPRTATEPASGYSLDAFLTAAAAAARAQNGPLPAPDQAFYQEQLTPIPGEKSGRCEVQWSPHPLSGVGEQVIEPNAVVSACANLRLGLPILLYLEGPGGQIDKYHLYPPLPSLPVRPAPLRSALMAAAVRGPVYWNLPAAYTADQVVFTLAGRLLEGPVSGSLRAALFEVIGDLPDVRLIVNVRDAIGRRGTGIEMRGLPDTPGEPWTIELIMAPRTYQFLGMTYGSAGRHTSYADVGSGLVAQARNLAAAVGERPDEGQLGSHC